MVNVVSLFQRKWHKNSEFGKYFMRNDAPEANLVKFLKNLAEHFENLKFEETRKVELFRPANSYILYCHVECGLFTLYLKENDMKNSEFGKY